MVSLPHLNFFHFGPFRDAPLEKVRFRTGLVFQISASWETAESDLICTLPNFQAFRRPKSHIGQLCGALREFLFFIHSPARHIRGKSGHPAGEPQRHMWQSQGQSQGQSWRQSWGQFLHPLIYPIEQTSPKITTPNRRGNTSNQCRCSGSS